MTTSTYLRLSHNQVRKINPYLSQTLLVKLSYLQLNTLLSGTRARTTDWILFFPLHLWSLRRKWPPSTNKSSLCS